MLGWHSANFEVVENHSLRDSVFCYAKSGPRAGDVLEDRAMPLPVTPQSPEPAKDVQCWVLLYHCLETLVKSLTLFRLSFLIYKIRSSDELYFELLKAPSIAF